MRKILFFIFLCLISTGYAGAITARDNNAVSRQSNTNLQRSSTTSVTKTSERTTSPRSGTTVTSRDVSNRNLDNVVSRSSVAPGNVSSKRASTSSISSKTPVTKNRSAVLKKTIQTSRSAVSSNTTSTSKTFGTGYNACRDSYFTCMDQFCAKQDETYRRCVCSSKLDEIKNKQRVLSQTQQQLQDFKDLNIDAISKTGNEVKSMLTATTGETTAGSAKDNSSSAQALNGISAVLSNTKSKSLSTQGKLDIAGDINSIWSTTDLAAGADISNLTGEKLYNAVHAQCVAFAANSCESQATLNMVVSAYGMYIENDCNALANSLSKQTTTAAGTIRETEYEMNKARLDNYNAHNSTSINNCIAQVRKDITTDSACGKDYVHCLDITGKYLNSDTGEPIYSSDFYQLELQTSLDGDVLSNQTNRLLISELNKKKDFAERGLSTCSDLSSEVWDEFLRQAVSEIYQGQQERIRQVKNECIDVVNSCYDSQSKSLKDFSNVKEQLLLGSRLELSEEMCKEKLDACSNLYGGGENGLSELVTTMQNITDQKIAKDCKSSLMDYVTSICSVSTNDIVHGFPFGCKTYAPGEQKYASIEQCNAVFSSTQTSDFEDTNFTGELGGENEPDNPGFTCPVRMKYTSCNNGYYMASMSGGVYIYNGTPVAGNTCLTCPDGYLCSGGTTRPGQIVNNDADATSVCGSDYIGSLYQKVVRYALQTCIRPSQSSNIIPTSILADVNVVMDSIKTSMNKELSTECERFGGIWVETPGNNVSSDKILKSFYTETSANKKWGYCSVKPSIICPNYSASDSSCASSDSTGVSSGCATTNCRCISGTSTDGSGGCTPGNYQCQGECNGQTTIFDATTQTPLTTSWTGTAGFRIRRKYNTLCSSWITVSGGTCSAANFSNYYSSCTNDNSFTVLQTCD
ncbi:MAG TPA: hypothetical protein PLZ05_00160 [Alphaproteobacteria bacterium]|nr:hypothetical protein [Alphaproteobacteria bacterium]